MAGSGLIVSDERGRLDLIVAHPVGRPPSSLAGRWPSWAQPCRSCSWAGWVSASCWVDQAWASTGARWLSPSCPPSPDPGLCDPGADAEHVPALAQPGSDGHRGGHGRQLLRVVLSFMDERLEVVSKLMPYHYFQIVLSFQELNLTWLFALLGASALMTMVAWLRFVRRDIRLSGEGSWRLPFRSETQENYVGQLEQRSHPAVRLPGEFSWADQSKLNKECPQGGPTGGSRCRG